jgi:hypothetical protein
MATDPTTTIPTRRALLAGAPAAAAGALAVAGIANTVAIGMSKAEVDPIFEVIERHRAIAEAYHEAHEHFEAMDEKYPRPRMPMEFPLWPSDERIAWVTANSGPTGTPRDGAYHRWSNLSDDVEKVTEELGTVAPTTMAGVAALLGYWYEIMDESSDHFDSSATSDFLGRLADALEATTGDEVE